MEAYLVAGYRSAVGKSGKGVFRFTRPDDLASEVIKHLMAQVPSLDKERVDDVFYLVVLSACSASRCPFQENDGNLQVLV